MPTNAEQRRYQVFVSSTYLDLQDERRAVITALLACDALPAGMELFPATDSDAWSLITDVIDSCDYYLLVIGGKYGSIDPQTQLSYTEKEYDYAASVGKPVMAFLHGQPNKLTLEQSEAKDEIRARLDAFRTKVELAKHVKYWTTADSLAGAVALTFNQFVKRHPAVGWIRADQATSSENLRENARLNERIRELETLLQDSRTQPPPGTTDLAQGDEEYPVTIWGTAHFPEENGADATVRAWVDYKMSWDAIFYAIGAKLLNEFEQRALKTAFNTYLTTYMWQPIEALLDEQRELEGKAKKQGSAYRDLVAEVDDEDFDTILIQLKALGLIKNSNRNRSVKDSGTYWTLTDYGQTRIVQVRAITADPEKLIVR